MSFAGALGSVEGWVMAKMVVQVSPLALLKVMEASLFFQTSLKFRLDTITLALLKLIPLSFAGALGATASLEIMLKIITNAPVVVVSGNGETVSSCKYR